MWDATVAAPVDGVQAHVLTLAGFAGTAPIKPPLAATVRKELVRYIHSHHLEKPIVIGHSMGGFIAYWLAATAPDLLGGVVVVDAGPALADNDLETAKSLRNMWAQAGDDELPEQVKNAYSSMTTDPKRIAPYLEAIAKSDRQTMGDAIFELVTTSVSDKVAQITAPLLLVLADGGYQQMYRQQAAAVPHHEVVVLPHTRHFVFFDDPAGWYKRDRQVPRRHRSAPQLTRARREAPRDARQLLAADEPVLAEPRGEPAAHGRHERAAAGREHAIDLRGASTPARASTSSSTPRSRRGPRRSSCRSRRA